MDALGCLLRVAWEASSCASSVPGAIEVRSLLEPGERVKNLKATVPLLNGMRNELQVPAYGRFSSELATLAAKHAVLRQSLSATLREAMRLHDGGKGLLDHAAVVRAALPAIAIVRRHGSADLRKATELALAHLPDLLAERARYAPSTSIRTGSAHGGSHGRQ